MKIVVNKQAAVRLDAIEPGEAFRRVVNADIVYIRGKPDGTSYPPPEDRVPCINLDTGDYRAFVPSDVVYPVSGYFVEGDPS